MTWQVLEADCVEAMAAMPAASVDAVVCDPPYGLEFMGKEWDRLGASASHRVDRAGEMGEENKRRYIASGVTYGQDTKAMQAWHEAWAREALRVLKPGGHLLAFGGTRTYHRLACAVEDAGFEVRDCLAWLYGSGFPKSLDVSKAIDNAAGAERERVAGAPSGGMASLNAGNAAAGYRGEAYYENGNAPLSSVAVTPDAERWQGWGTALKPAHEPIVLARKPLTGTVAANVLAHGTGALNVDGCRIGTDDGLGRFNNAKPPEHRVPDSHPDAKAFGRMQQEAALIDNSGGLGRWPANVVMDEQAAAILDAQTGESASSDRLRHNTAQAHNRTQSMGQSAGDWTTSGYADSGGASRFLYVAKASSAERNAGLDGFEERDMGEVFSGGMAGASIPLKGSPPPRYRNVHPTVKPIELMRWLVRLVTPPDGVVLDPFTGSGTTGIACVLEGVRFVGIEREPEYAAIARARIAWWMAHPEGVEIVKALEAERTRQKIEGAGQVSLFDTAAEPAPDASGNGRAGEATADQRYTDSGASNFAMRPGRRRP
jgi:DNA modification methylase